MSCNGCGKKTMLDGYALCFDCGQSKVHELTTAANLRTAAREALANLKTSACRVTELEGLLREVAGAGVEFDDARLGYLSIQIDRGTWNEIRRVLEVKP